MISADSLEIECCNEMDAAIIGSSSKMNWRRSTAQTAVYIQLRYLKCSQLEWEKRNYSRTADRSITLSHLINKSWCAQNFGQKSKNTSMFHVLAKEQTFQRANPRRMQPFTSYVNKTHTNAGIIPSQVAEQRKEHAVKLALLWEISLHRIIFNMVMKTQPQAVVF